MNYVFIAKTTIFYKKKILLIQRSAHKKHAPNLWTTPGGNVDNGETFEQAAIREAKEETDLDVTCIGCYFTRSFKAEEKDTQMIFCEFLCTTDSDKVIINNESQDYKWISFEEFEKLQPKNAAAIKKIKEFTKDLVL